jgi:predicted 3-demethylubiquinone-9 3-methyltransferase (glyoxalase superfamily)
MGDLITCLWFDGRATEAARFYAEVFGDEVEIHGGLTHPGVAPGDEGEPLTVEFTIRGQKFMGLNGGPMFTFSEATSFQIMCRDQAEVDHFWEALTADGGEPGQCGWCKDRFGVSWQVVPEALPRLLSGGGARAKRVMEAFMPMTKLDIAAIEAAAAEVPA